MNETDDTGDTAASLTTLLLAAIGLAILAYMLMPTAAGATVCLSKREARHLWPRQHIWWYSGDHCWSNRRGGPPRGLKLEPEEPKQKKIKTDPIFPPRAEEEIEVELGAVTWHMRRPFNEAQPIYPPLNLAVPDDPDACCWPDLSEFERRFVGVQP